MIIKSLYYFLFCVFLSITYWVYIYMYKDPICLSLKCKWYTSCHIYTHSWKLLYIAMLFFLCNFNWDVKIKMLCYCFNTDAQMGQNWGFKFGWRDCFGNWISDVVNNHPSHTTEILRALLLHTLPLHHLHDFLHTPCWYLLLWHDASQFLPLCCRSLLEVSTITTKCSITLCPRFTMWNSWT